MSYFDDDRIAIRVAVRIAISISVMLFCVSLCFDAFYVEENGWSAVGPGVSVIFGVFSGSVSWYANPLLFASWMTLPHREFRDIGAIAGTIAVLLSLWFLATVGDEITTHSMGPSGDKTILGVGIGYWFWVCSITVNAIGGGIVWLMTPRVEAGSQSVPTNQIPDGTADPE